MSTIADTVSSPRRARGALAATVGWILLTNPGSFTMVLGPVFTNALVTGRGLGAAQAAGLGAVELIGMALATLAIGFLPLGRAARTCPARAAAVAMAVAVAGQLATMAPLALPALGLVRLAVGAGTGAAFTLAIAALARSPDPDRQFGLQMAANQLSIFLLLNLAARLAGAGGPMTPVMVVAGATALSLVATLLLGGSRPVADGPVDVAATAPVPRRAAALAIATCLVFNAGVGAFWPLAGQVAAGAGVAPAGIASAFAWAPLSAIAGGMAAAILGGRLPRLPLLLAGNALMAAAMVMMGRSADAAAFLACVSLFLFLWLIMMPYYFGLLAALDPSGRLASLSGLLLAAGMAAGQMFATGWLGMAGAGSLWQLGVGHLAVSALLAIATARGLRRA